MIELFIEGSQVDVNETFSTIINLMIDDVKDFGAKNTSFTKTMILPGTKRNNIVMGNIFEVTAANDYDPALPNVGKNFNPAIAARAFVFANNIQAIKGIVRVLDVINDDGFIEYEINVTGELGGFVAKMGTNMLEDLDFSAYDCAYTLESVIDSWDKGPGDGVVFPLIDYGKYSSDKVGFVYRTFRPSIFVKDYVDKIIEKTGYTYNCALFNTARFKALLNPFNRKTLQIKSTAIFDVTPDFPGVYAPPANPYDYPFSVQTTLGSFTTSDNKTFTYGGASVTGTLNLTMSGAFDNYGFSTPINISVYKNYGTGTQVILGSYAFGSGVHAGFFAANIDCVGATFLSGDTLDVKVTGQIIFFGGYSIDVSAGRMTFTSAVALDVEINLGDTLAVNNTLPKGVLQKDYISSILKLFNCYVFEDYDTEKRLNIMPFIDFYANAEVDDWSLKVDRSKPMKYKPMGELNARYYEFNFKDDSDFYNDLYKKRYGKTYGSYIYDSMFEAAGDKISVDVIFAGSPLVSYAGGDKCYTSIFKQSGTTEDNCDSVLRILQFKKISVSRWNIFDTDGTTVLASPAEYGYAGHFDDPDAPANDINFGVPEELFFTLATGALNVNQFNVYWSSYMAEITDKDSKLLTCTLKLSLSDIYKLDFSRLKYIDGALFRINKITDFNASEDDVCEGELLKVINRLY